MKTAYKKSNASKLGLVLSHESLDLAVFYTESLNIFNARKFHFQDTEICQKLSQNAMRRWLR